MNLRIVKRIRCAVDSSVQNNFKTDFNIWLRDLNYEENPMDGGP